MRRTPSKTGNRAEAAVGAVTHQVGGLLVALSGADNTGKSTQLRVLARRIAAYLVGPLESYDPRWGSIRDSGMAAWWFEEAPVEEVADVLGCSYLERARQAPGATLRLVDRGIPMLEASLAATVAVREDLDPARAAERAAQLLAGYGGDLSRAEAAEHGAVLLHDLDPAAGAARSLAREPAADRRYAAYQRHLNTQVLRIARDGRFESVIITGDRPVMAVQAELRERFTAVVPGIPPCRLPAVTVVALGGMSESGKSTAAEYLRTRHGFARLKIGYLIEEAAARCQIADPYREPASTQAELLIDSLDRFCAAHHFLTRVSLESVHRDEPATELRKILGHGLCLTYLNTAARVREQRGTSGPADVRERDAVKHRRGASTVAAIADRVIGNDGSRLALCRQLDGLVAGLTAQHQRLRTIPVNNLGLPVHLESYLAKLVDAASGDPPLVDLLAVTGSGARGKYQHGWSDLDVLVIADNACLARLRRILAEVADDLDGVKLGLTLVTPAECAASAVTPRVLHVLRTLGTGDIAPLLCREALALPVPGPDTDAAESLRDGTQAAIEIRRQLLRGIPDLRALYKVTALLAKVMLRFEGTECPSDDKALRTLLPQAQAAGARAGRARSDRAAAEEMALAVLNAWLSQLPAAGDAT